MNSLPLRFLEWDTTFFGRRIGRITDTRITQETLQAVIAQSEQEQIDGLYFLCESDSPASSRAAEAHGFHLMDMRVTLDHPLTSTFQVNTPARLRPVQTSDQAALRELARGSFTDSRFYADPHFTRDQCDQLYETWLTNALRDHPDGVIVAEVNGQVAGYITCEIANAIGEIGLIGVSPAHQGLRIGTALTAASVEWFRQHGAHSAEVVTQGRNIAAQRMYQTCGFRTKRVQLWYHRWRVL